MTVCVGMRSVCGMAEQASNAVGIAWEKHAARIRATDGPTSGGCRVARFLLGALHGNRRAPLSKVSW